MVDQSTNNSGPSSTREDRPRSAWRSKWRYVWAYWILQAVAMHIAAAAFASDGSITSTSGIIAALVTPDLLLISGIAAGTVTVLQAVLLFAIRRPRESGLAAHARFLHCVVVGLAMAALSWLAMWPVMYLLEEIFGTGRWVTSFFSQPTGLAFPLLVFGITLVLMWHYGRNGVPAIVSAVIAAAGAAATLGALAALLWSIPRVIRPTTNPATASQRDDNPYEKATLGSAAGATLVGWAVGTPLVLAFMRRRGGETALARLSAGLFLGTIVEAAAAIPLDVMIRKKSDCYCGESTFWTLSFCWAAGSLALGPVIFLVPFSKRRKRWYAGLCDVCGYDMSGCMNADRCPECGAGWKRDSAETAGRGDTEAPIKA